MNKQITEDYVSFEIAKLLKEKGFIGNNDVGCRCGFYEQNKEYPNQINLVYDDLNNSELECNECLRFTYQMAMKWLREVHNIHIKISLDSFDGIHPIYEALYDDVMNIRIDNFIDYGDTYEQACEVAIKYCLLNLI